MTRPRRSGRTAQYTSLLNATNAGLAANEQASGADFLPCEVNQPVTADRCATPGDANWAGSNLWGQNAWDVYLQGGTLNGILGDPAQTDNLYQMGFSRLAGSVPYPSFGAYTGYSVALNTGYAAAALYGNAYRDLPITSYAWQINTTTGGPNAWWEANGSPPDPANPWAGSHAAPAVRRDPVRVADGQPDPDTAPVAGRPGLWSPRRIRTARSPTTPRCTSAGACRTRGWCPVSTSRWAT